MKSKSNNLNTQDFRNQLKSAVVWLAPLVLVYITQLQGTIQANNGLGWKDFQPTWMSLGAMELYIVNQVYGLFNRYKEGRAEK